MKDKIKNIIGIIFGTKSDLLLKVSTSLFISGTFFLIFAFIHQGSDSSIDTVFVWISGILFAIWLTIIDDHGSSYEIIFKVFRLCVFFLWFVFSLIFCMDLSIRCKGMIKIIFYSVSSCIGILSFSFYCVSKLFDVFKFIKDLINQYKHKLFDPAQPAISKITSLIENITAFFVAITGLGVAIVAIVTPLIDIVKQFL